MKPRISHTRTVASEYSERSFNYLQHPLTHRKRNANSIPAVKCHIKHFRLRQLTAPRTFTKTKLNAVTAEKCWNDFFFFESKTAAKTHIWVRFEFWERFFLFGSECVCWSVKLFKQQQPQFQSFFCSFSPQHVTQGISSHHQSRLTKRKHPLWSAVPHRSNTRKDKSTPWLLLLLLT